MTVPKEIHIVLVIWGNAFWHNFFNYSLFTRLTEYNLPELSKHFNLKYKIFTTPADIENYSNSEELKELNKFVKISFHPFDYKKNACKYSLFSKIQNRAIKEAGQERAGVIFDSPDHIYSNRIFGNFIPIITAGKRLILTQGIRLSLEGFTSNSLINKKVLRSKNFDNKDLMQGALTNLHPYTTKQLFKNNPEILSWSSTILWKLNNSNFIQSSFHLHPFYIWPEKVVSMSCQTVDSGEYLYKACPNTKKHHICTDSKLMYFELSENNLSKESNKKKPTLLAYLYWMRSFAHPKQSAYLFKKKIYFSSKPKISHLTSLRINSFITLLFFMRKIPLWILKPFLHKEHQIYIQKKVKFFYFLRKVKLWNYYESLLRNHYNDYDIDDIISYISDNLKSLRYEILRKIAVIAFQNLDKNSYPNKIEKLLKVVHSNDFFGQFCHEAAKVNNRFLVQSLIKTNRLASISKKQFGYFIKELAIQNFHEELYLVLKNYPHLKKIHPKFIEKIIYFLLQHKSQIAVINLFDLFYEKNISHKEILKHITPSKGY
ncbi:MAG: hypothetical protein S4CHLAM7_10170 [Chlamydiae bacterium]|nr:hypothetical protein [Chlamydiota bacterium]